MSEPTWVNPWEGEEYPSIPGKPETYSPTYHKFLELLRRNMATDPLTKEEAGEVYRAVYALVEGTVPEGGLLMCLYDQLVRERVKGLRCSVCGKYQDSSCIQDC